MNSYQNIALLQNLYRLKALGFSYVDPIQPNAFQPKTLPLADSYATLCATISQCHLCDLSKSRTQSMAGWGNLNPTLLFVDEVVSSAEDSSNSYYVGRSGTMLRDMIEKVLQFSTEEVYFTHAVKCKPYGFQKPSPSECRSCSSFLQQQLTLLSPKLIVTLGENAYHLLTHDEGDFEQVRGQCIPFGEHTVVPLYHPSFLIRNPSFKKEAMRDLHTIHNFLLAC
jgi:DNA polymerase